MKIIKINPKSIEDIAIEMLTEIGRVDVYIGGLGCIDLSEIFGGNGWSDSDLEDKHTNWFFSEVYLDGEGVSAVGNILSDY